MITLYGSVTPNVTKRDASESEKDRFFGRIPDSALQPPA